MSVIVGVDPHMASHTAVAIGGDEREIAKVTVRATFRNSKGNHTKLFILYEVSPI
jgi:hypothetical protein